MTDGADDSLMNGAQPEPLDDGDVVLLDSPALDPYSEDDDLVTQQVEAMVLEPRWLVQFTPLDRRLMETSELVAALLGGTLRADTLVWRGGMDDWLPVGRLDLLSPSAIPTLPPKHREAASASSRRSGRPTSRGPSVRAKPLELTLASLAIALSAATITTSFLSIAGVFDASGTPTRVQALRAEAPTSEPRPAEREGSVAREGGAHEGSVAREGELPPPDPQRATAVAR